MSVVILLDVAYYKKHGMSNIIAPFIKSKNLFLLNCNKFCETMSEADIINCFHVIVDKYKYINKFIYMGPAFNLISELTLRRPEILNKQIISSFSQSAIRRLKYSRDNKILYLTFKEQSVSSTTTQNVAAICVKKLTMRMYLNILLLNHCELLN